jgi:hypothetical protein
MLKKELDIRFDKSASTRSFVDRLPISEEGKHKLSGLLMVLGEIEEAHKNELWGSRKYAMIRGGKVLEGSPTELGFADKQKVPVIFKVRIATDHSRKKPLFRAYSINAGCVANGSTWKKALKAMHEEIVRVLELQNEQVPRPIIMEVDKCHAGGDLWFYESIKKKQKRYEPIYLQLKEAREFGERIKREFEDPGKTRLFGTEE